MVQGDIGDYGSSGLHYVSGVGGAGSIFIDSALQEQGSPRTIVGPNNWSDVQSRLENIENITKSSLALQGFISHGLLINTELLLPVEGSLELEIEYPWLESFHADREDADSTTSAKLLIDIIDPLMASDRWKIFDNIMSRLNSPRYSSLFLLSLLRFTRIGKRNIFSWNAFRDGVSQELASRGLESKKMMRGL